MSKFTGKHDGWLVDAPLIIYERRQRNNSSHEDQCDCACTISPTIDRQLSAHSKNVSHSLDTSDQFLMVPLTTNYYAILRRDTNLIVLNRSALDIANHYRRSRLLDDFPLAWRKLWGKTVIQPTLVQMVTLGLLVPERQTTFTIEENASTLSAWLHITDRCNLRCAYCYLPHERVDMSRETGRAAIDATFRSALDYDYRKVKFKYAGGEAMLRFPFVVELHRYAQTLADRFGLDLDGVILSNGTRLTTEIVKMMQLLGLHLMISLDGLGQVHDQQRSFDNGRGSAADVSAAIELALENGLTPDISITISGRNVEGLPELMDWILKRDLPFSFNFYRDSDLSNLHTGIQQEAEKIINGMLAAYKVIEANLPHRSLLASLVDRANLAAPHLRTCSVGHSYLVFDCLGQVAKCQMQIDKPIATTQAEDPLGLIRADKAGTQSISVDEKQGCRECEWKYWCTGGCPLATYRATGRYDVKSPNCSIYKALFPEVVRLEGLRMLKNALIMKREVGD